MAEMNGEAIYGTTAWVTAGEGPTKLAVSEMDSRGTI